MKTIYLKNRRTEGLATLVVITWGLTVFLAGYYNLFKNTALPIFGATVIAIQVSLILLYLYNRPFREFSNAIPLSAIAIFHSWRIIAGWLFLMYAGLLPDAFINNAAYGDIIAGFLGLLVIILGRLKWTYLLFNILGLLDFLLAVGTGLTLTLLGNDDMRHIATLPLILIPLFGVPISGFTHFISLYRIAGMKGKKLNDYID